jgi:hypothetical protein
MDLRFPWLRYGGIVEFQVVDGRADDGSRADKLLPSPEALGASQQCQFHLLGLRIYFPRQITLHDYPEAIDPLKYTIFICEVPN